MNIEQSNRNISPFSGLYFIADAANRLNIRKFININLPFRSINAHYQYSDIALSLFANALLQGDRLSDLELVKQKYSIKQGFKIPSPDTVEYACQELKPMVCQEFVLNQKGQIIDHQHCFQPRMNRLLSSLALKLGKLKTGNQNYTLDFDHMVIDNQKQDARMTYKMVKGYHPCFAFINRLPVYIENHNGNSPARHHQKDSLERCFETLNSQEIEIENFRADSASYQKEVIELVVQKCKYFFIRMMEFSKMRENYGQIPECNWKKVKIGLEEVEVASIKYSLDKSENTYRLVVTRRLRADKQLSIETGTAYSYQAIITNQIDWSEQQVIVFYNQRGDAENSNRFMLNDFNLKYLPFMDVNTNTVYMYMMGYAAILFEWSKALLLKNKVEGITASMRVKAVCFRYISVAGEWIVKKGKDILKIFSKQKYDLLQI